VVYVGFVFGPVNLSWAAQRMEWHSDPANTAALEAQLKERGNPVSAEDEKTATFEEDIASNKLPHECRTAGNADFFCTRRRRRSSGSHNQNRCRGA